MGKSLPKLRHVFNLAGIVLLFGISVISWQGGTELLRFKRLLTYEGASSDPLIVVQERPRARILIDVLKKIAFTDWGLPDPVTDVQVISCSRLKSLLISAYQRNVFYVYASFSVP